MIDDYIDDSYFFDEDEAITESIPTDEEIERFLFPERYEQLT